MLNQKTIIAKELIDNNRLNEAESILLGLNDKFSLFELAKLRRIQGRNREAEQLYLKSLSVQPEIKYPIESDINIELGRIYAGFGKIEEATKRYLNGLDRICLDKNIYAELGELYSNPNLKDYEKAEEYLEKAIKLFPNDNKTNMMLGITYRRLGKDELAKNIFNKLLTRNEIRNNKFLYNKILNEYEIIMKRECLESKPREMRVTITNKCNIGCRYCDIWKFPNWQLQESRVREIMEGFPYLENMNWLGGETFLYKGFEEVLEEGSKYDTLHQTIYTNGLLLTERVLEKISKANISLLIAIDAGKKETYEYLRRGASWNKLCKNLELIKEVSKKTNKKIRTVFNAVISKSNYKEIFDMVEMANKYDFNEIRFMSILGNSDENIWLNKDIEALLYLKQNIELVLKRAQEYNIFADFNKLDVEGQYYNDINVKFAKEGNYKLTKSPYKFLRCIGPYKNLVIDSKGPMRPCVNCHDWLGDSSKQTINEFWNCEGMQTYRKLFSNMYMCDSEKTTGPDQCGCVTSPNVMWTN